MKKIKYFLRSLLTVGLKYAGAVIGLIFRLKVRLFFNHCCRLLNTSLYSSDFRKLHTTSLISNGLTLVGGQYIEIAENCWFGKNGVLSAWSSYAGEFFNPEIIIGPNCNIGDYFHISAIKSIVMGRNVLIGRWVSIVDNGHGKNVVSELDVAPIERKLYSKGPIVIGDNVWIGDKVTILSNVIIGSNSVIGANSVVTRDVPANAIVAGSPAQIIKMLS